LTIKLFFTKFSSGQRRVSGAAKFLFVCVAAIVFFGGCAVQETPKISVAVPEVVVTPKPIALTVEADAALKAAAQSVIEARIKRALWSAAVEELERAQAAAKTFDSAATFVHARKTIALCDQSIAQLSKAPVKW
jgi:hypothetical protein